MTTKDSQKKALLDLVTAINDCLDRQQILPCLVLLYSGIEIVAQMSSEPNEPTNVYFKRWVERYILSKNQFSVSAVDLYAARCGVVHAFSPDSDLYRNGKAKRISYSWGSASMEKLNASIAALELDLASLHLNAFVRAFSIGIADFMDELESDPVARQRAADVRSSWFTNVSPALIDSLLDHKSSRRKSSIAVRHRYRWTNKVR